MTEKISVNSASKLSEAITKLSAMYRTLDQNALWFSLYERIAQMTPIGDVEDARKYCKLHVGVPIMRAEDEDFRASWNRVLLNLPYETKLELMGPCPLFGPEGFPVTRLFNRAQGIAYTDRIVAEFSGKGVFFGDLLGEKAA